MVTRLVLGLSALFAAAVLLFAFATGHRPAQPPAPGVAGQPRAERLFEQHCGACHTVADAAEELSRTPRSGRAQHLSAFLPGHCDVPEADARAITAFLVAEADGS